MSCTIKDRIINTAVRIAEGNATSFKRVDNQIFIPFTSKKIKNKQSSFEIAKRKVKEINTYFDSDTFGETAFLNTSFTDAVGIKIEPSLRLIRAEEIKEEEKEYYKNMKDNPDNILSEEARINQEEKLYNAEKANEIYSKDLSIVPKYFPNSSVQNSVDVLHKIANSSHSLAALAKELVKYAENNNVQIELVDVASFEAGSKDNPIKASGFYDSGTNKIQIAKNALFRHGKVETAIVHEVLHAISYFGLRQNLEVNKKFKELYEYALTKLDKDKYYGLLDLDEFLVALFSNSNLIKSLEGLESPIKNEYKNLLANIFDLLLKLLKINKKSSLYETAFAVATNIIDNQFQHTERLKIDNLTTPFFNLSEKDLTRLHREFPLESMLAEVINHMYNVTNPSKKVKGVKILDLKNYKKSRPNYNILGVADIAGSTIYLDYQNIDGITPIEEQMHFLVHALWNHPVFLPIRENIEVFHESQTWQTNYPIYLSQYNGDVNQTEKELIGKILSEYLYDKESTRGLTGKLKYILRTIKNNIVKLFGGTVKEKVAFNKLYTDKLKSLLEGTKATPGIVKLLESKELKKIAEKGELNYTDEGVVSPDFDITKGELIAAKQLNIIILEKKQLEAEKTGLNRLERTEFDNFYANPMFDELKDNIKTKGVTVRRGILSELERKDISTEYKNNLKKLYKYFIEDVNEAEKAKFLKKLEERTENLEKLIKEKSYIIGISNFLFGTNKEKYDDYIEEVQPDGTIVLRTIDALDSSGILNDFTNLLKIIDDINNDNRILDVETYERLRQTVGLYKPLLVEVDKIYHALNKGNINTTNVTSLVGIDGESNMVNHKIYKGVELGLQQVDRIERFMVNNNKQVKKNLFMFELGVPEELLERLELTDDHTFTEINWFYKIVGQYQHVDEDIIKLLQRELMILDKNIAEKTSNYATELYNRLSGDLKRHKNDIKLLQEKNKKGELTNFLISDVHTEEYVKAQEEYRKEIVKSLKAKALELGMNISTIPNNYNQLYDYFKMSSFYSNDPLILDKELQNRAVLQNTYYSLWNDWRAENTEPLPESEIDKIKETKKSLLSSRDYKIWWDKNHYTIEGLLYYKGELVKPSKKKYSNPKFENIKNNPGLYRIYNEIKNSIYETKSKINKGAYSYEYFMTLPQIGKSSTQIAADLDIKSARDNVREIASVRVDDDFYAERFNGKVLKRPPIRFEKPLPPHLITQDFIYSIVSFYQMGENYVEKSKNMMKLQGYIDIVNDSVVMSGNKQLVQGSSNLQSSMEDLVKKFIYGETMDKFSYGGYDISKLSNNIYKWTVARNLLGNTAAALTGLTSGILDTINDIIVGKYNSKSDYKRGTAIYTKNVPGIIKDFESADKTNKITILASELGLVDDTLERFQNTNVNKATRVIGSTISWGFWRASDTVLKYPSMITTAIGIKKHDNKWYTKTQWEDLDIPNKPSYDSLDTLWDNITVKEGKIDWKNVPENVKELFKVRALNIASQLDTQPTNYDKGMAQSNFIAKMFTVHTGWLWQMLARNLKSRSYNYMLQEYTQGDLRYTVTSLINPLQWASIYRSFNNIGDPLIKENFKRVGIQMLLAYITFTTAYILAAAALDDDEEEDPILQFSNYLAMRAYNEQAARLGVAEVIQYITKPGSLIQEVTGIFSMFDMFLEFFDLSDEESKVKSGIYEDYTQGQKYVMKNIPFVKGIFEGIGGGLINEALGKPATSSAIAYSKKSDFIKNNVIRDKHVGDALFSMPLGLYPKIFGGYSGELISRGLLENYNTDAFLNMGLPTKKANKDQ